MEHEKQRILVVDDSRLNAQIIRDILAEDYEILVATSGQEALGIVMVKSVDLILLDVVMPKMDGYEVCRRLKNDLETKNIPVIFVSAARNVEDETKGLECGAIDYITNPFNPFIIKARVKNHLELKKYRDILEKLSLIDGLTSIANRRYFDETYEKEWRRALRNEDTLSLIMLDIDFFKKYNDHYGHLAGDECLRKVANVLRKSIKRAGDLVARYGGEEFIVILPSTSKDHAFEIAEKMRKDIESLKITHQMSEVSRSVTVSAGVATVKPSKGMSPARLIEKVDSALYQAKNKGRNVVVWQEYS